MATGDKGVGRGLRIDVEPRLAAKPQWHIRTPRTAHGALPLLTLCFDLRITAPSPAMVAMHMAAAQVCPWLLLIQDVLATQAGEGQCVEAHGTLWPPGIQLLPQGLQVFDSGSEGQSFGRAPQQGGTTQVDKRPIHQLVGLRFHLGGGINDLGLMTWALRMSVCNRFACLCGDQRL